ncbi:MAG TPA: hypothetical protein VN937_21525 [Blastocatellia bacterium]|nr:hypothetical protein [Blastocatellia bacterium]
MIRKVLIIAFVLSVATNSLAGVLPYITGDGNCEANCCRVHRMGESRARVSGRAALRCLTQCEHPAENQGVPESPVLRTERDSKAVAHAAPPVQSVCSTVNARLSHSTTRINFESTHIYLKTGTLLI